LASNWFRIYYQSYILENKVILAELKRNQRVLYFQHSKDLLENAYTGLIMLMIVDKLCKLTKWR
jgi:hypothetical protein